MLQFSLVVGDRAVIDREVQHLAAYPEYKDRANKVLQRVRSRG